MPTISQTEHFDCTPHQLYEALMDEKQHAAFTASAAKISPELGGSFSTFGDYATGKNHELVPDQKIVQSWRASDWLEDHFSTATFEFTEDSKGGTTLSFTQTDVPEDDLANVAQGWIDYYWEPLRHFLKKT